MKKVTKSVGQKTVAIKKVAKGKKAKVEAPGGGEKVQTKVVKPIEANFRIMHVAAHADEGFADWVIRKYGRESFPGIEVAPLKLVEDSPVLTESEADEKGFIMFGTGGGRFDEHRKNGRLKDSSCTKLVVDYLKIADKATLALAKEIHWCDSNGRVSNTQLSELIKSAHRNMPAGTELVLKWLDQAFDVLHEQLSMNFSQGKGEFSALDYFVALTNAGRYANKEIQSHVSNLFIKSAKNSHAPNIDRTFLTEIDFVVRAMQRVGKESGFIYQWLQFAIERLWADQVLFNKALNEVSEKRNRHPVWAKSPTHQGNLWFTMVRTDNAMALRASNFLRQQITVIRNGKGQVQIFLDQKTGLNLDIVMGMIRFIETPVERRSLLNWHEICTTPGNHPSAPNWNYNREVGQIFNGSSTHPGVPPTPLMSKMIVAIIKSAFHPDLIARWKKNYGVVEKPVTK